MDKDKVQQISALYMDEKKDETIVILENNKKYAKNNIEEHFEVWLVKVLGIYF